MNELQQQTKAFIESECAKLNCASIATPLIEGYAAICEAESDAGVYKMALSITNQFLSEDTVNDICQMFEKFGDTSKFATKKDLQVTREITSPFHILITAAMYSHDKKLHQLGNTNYGGQNLPHITIFLSDSTRKLRKPHEETNLNWHKSYDPKYPGGFIEQLKDWKEIIVHEVAHALDALSRRTIDYNPSTKRSLKQANGYQYANDLREINARIPQYAYLISQQILERGHGRPLVPFRSTLQLFDSNIKQFASMSDDTKRRTVKRLYDIYLKIREAWEKHGDDIRTIEDLINFVKTNELKAKKSALPTPNEYLRDAAAITTPKGCMLKFKRDTDGFYEVVGGTCPNDIGTKVKFEPQVLRSFAQNNVLIFNISDAKRKDGSPAPFKTLPVAKISYSN